MSELPGPPSNSPVVMTRYGVLLTPDAETSAAVTAVTGFIRAQYGLVSAGAFPPHATLVGSLPIAGGESGLIEALDAALAAVAPVHVQNIGVRELGDVVIYDVSELDGRENAGIRDLARRVDDAVAPLLAPTVGFPADRYIEDRFHAHFSLASHDLYVRPDLRAEVARFAAALPVTVPKEFVADTVTAYRFEHPTWDGPWWQHLRWAYVRTWRLTA